jgi:cytochrome c-type biogenesis protein CcmF
VGRNRRRYGGYIVHAAIVLVAIGVAGSAYDSIAEGRLQRGETLAVGDWTVAYQSLTQERAANALELRARVDLYRDGELTGTIFPGKNRYFAEQQTSNEMAIHTDWLRAEDVDVIADQVNADGSVYFRVLVKPLMNLLWLAGFVFLAGSLVALWPDAREERRLALRYGTAEAPAGA